MNALKNKTRISITILPLTNKLLEKLSKRSGISKSSLIEKAVNDFFKKRLEQDAKILAGLNFEDLPSEEEWLSIQSENN